MLGEIFAASGVAQPHSKRANLY